MSDDYNGIELFSKLKGRVIKKITGNEAPYTDRLLFKMGNGDEFVMYHSQDCCENVRLEEVIGDLGDIVGKKLTMAEVVSSSEDPKDFKKPEEDCRESFTWTFYKLSTIKGSVTLRWLGTSNGYYSESVTFARAGTER